MLFLGTQFRQKYIITLKQVISFLHSLATLKPDMKIRETYQDTVARKIRRLKFKSNREVMHRGDRERTRNKG